MKKLIPILFLLVSSVGYADSTKCPAWAKGSDYKGCEGTNKPQGGSCTLRDYNGNEIQGVWIPAHTGDTLVLFCKANNTPGKQTKHNDRKTSVERKNNQAYSENNSENDLIKEFTKLNNLILELFSVTPTSDRKQYQNNNYNVDRSSKNRSCTSDFSCAIGYRCVKPPLTSRGECLESVDEYGLMRLELPDLDSIGVNMNISGECSFNTDCPIGFQCDSRLKACVK